VTVAYLQAGWTALLEASYYGYVDIVRQLLATPEIDVNAAAQVITL
jgi:ankyrin repeat protein